MPDGDVVLRGSFIPTGNTPFSVEHYFEGIDGKYYLDSSKTQNMTGAAGKTVTAVPLSGENIIGFTFNAEMSQDSRTGMIVSSEPHLILELYYDRTEHKVIYQFAGNVPEDAEDDLPAEKVFKYGDTVVVEDDLFVPGYKFVGWICEDYGITEDSSSFTMPAGTVELTGRFEPLANSYTVEHYLMGTDGRYSNVPDHSFKVDNVFTGQSVETATASTHTGFYFDSTTTSDQYKGIVAANGATVLKVYFAREKYTLSYDYDHSDDELITIDPSPAKSQLPKNIEYYYGEEVTLEADASAIGYIFTGWSIHTGDTAIKNGKIVMPAGNVVIHGAFNADPNTKYTVEHWLESSDSSDASDVNNYERKDSLTQTLRGSTGAAVTATPLSDSTLIGYNFNAELSEIYRSGTIANNGSTVLKLYYKLTESKVIYEYTGDLPANAPQLPAEETYKYGVTVKLEDDAVLKGYKFSGWKLHRDHEISVENGEFTMPEHAVYIYGSFSPNPSQYTVEHYLMDKDGSYPADPTLSVLHKTNVLVDDEVTASLIDSYKAYSYDEDTTRAKLASGLRMPDTNGVDLPSGIVNEAGTLVIKLYYSRNLYDISYEFLGNVPDGAELPDPMTDIRHGTDVDLSDPKAIPEGYNFKGWYLGDVFVGETLTMPEKDIVVTGFFSPKTDVKYRVEYWLENVDDDEYTETNDSYETVGTTDTSVTGPRKDFDGFTFNMEKSSWNGHIKGDGSLVLKLYYKRNVHKVNYFYHDAPPANVTIRQDGNVVNVTEAYQKIATAEYKYGQTVTVDPILSADTGAYVFRGWYTPDLEGVTLHTEIKDSRSFTMPDLEVNFYGALYNYVVLYDLNGGTHEGSDEIDNKEVEWHDDDLIPAGTPEKDGMIFKGWIFEETEEYVDGDHKYSELAIDPHVDSIKLVATYAPGYTVSYTWGSTDIPDGVTLPTDSGLYEDGDRYSVDTTYKANDSIDVTDAYGNVVGRYSFSGWTDPSNGVIDKQSVIIVGKWTYTDVNVDTWTVTYEWSNAPAHIGIPSAVTGIVNGSSYTVDTRYEYGTIIFNTDENSQILGVWSFSGWDINGTITVNSDITIRGSWVYFAYEQTPKTGSVTVTKVDSADASTTLSGVVFDLYGKDGALIGTYTTGKDGKITVSDLTAGDYYWIEIRPHEGYRRDESKHEFTVSGGKTLEMNISNTRTEVPSVFGDDHYAYVIGYEDGTVQPLSYITRAEVATIFFRLLGDGTRAQHMTRTNSFSDVKAEDWFNTAVSTMAAMGVVNGYPDGTFRPNEKITRAEFAAIAARFDSNGNTTGASFLDIYEHWAYKEINIAANNGWVLGYEDGSFKPNQPITRAEAMAMVNRILQRIPENTGDLLPDMIKWPDNADSSAWFYLTIQEATNSHTYARKPSSYEYWLELRPNRDWAALEKQASEDKTN